MDEAVRRLSAQFSMEVILTSASTGGPSVGIRMGDSKGHTPIGVDGGVSVGGIGVAVGGRDVGVGGGSSSTMIEVVFATTWSSHFTITVTG